MHGRAATGAIGILGLDRHIEPRQMTRQRTAIGAPLFRPRLRSRWIALVGGGFVGGDSLLSVLDRQKQLIGIKLLGAAAELRPLQLPQQMTKAVILRERVVALGKGGIALSACHHKQRLQRFDVSRKLRSDVAHARY